MTATEYCFPRFLPGQVLTDDDLNDLRADYARRVLNLGTLVGFGVGCGLDGRIDGSELVVDPGYAVDQEGRLLVLRSEQRINVTSVTTASVDFPFVEADEGGFTAVLRAREDPEPAPGPCGDPNCDTHSETVCERVEIVLVPGRLLVTDASEREVFELEPLRITGGDQVDGSIASLRDDLVDALEGHVAPEVLGLLADIDGRSKTGALPVQRASLLNTVLVLTWDLYRCLAWMRLACFRDDRPVGVALGHLGGPSTARTWACEWRHHFELSAAIARAILGYRCEDPCRRFRVKLEAVITGYREIEIPEPTDPPRNGGPPVVDVCKPMRVGKLWWYECDWVVVPPPLVEEPDWIHPPWVDPIPDPIPDPFPDPYPGPWFDDWWTDPNPLDPWILPVDPTHSGLVNVVDLLGRPGAEVQPHVTETLGGAGITTPVDVMSLDEARALEGYRASPVVVGSDHIIIAVDAQGRTVETGSVPTTLGLRGAGPNAKLARTEASAALSDASVARHDAGVALEGVDGLTGNVAHLESQLGVIGGEVETVVGSLAHLESQLGVIGGDLGTVTGGLGELEGRLEELMPSVERYVDTVLGSARAELLTEVRTELEAAVGQVADEIRGDLGEIRGDLGRFRGDLERVDHELGGRIDRVVTGFATGRSPVAVERTVAANEAVFDSLSALREAAGTVREGLSPRARNRFDQEMETVEASLSTVEGAVRSDRPLLEAEGASVVAAADALGRALRAAGVTGAPRRDMESSLKRLGEVVVRR